MFKIQCFIKRISTTILYAGIVKEFDNYPLKTQLLMV